MWMRKEGEEGSDEEIIADLRDGDQTYYAVLPGPVDDESLTEILGRFPTVTFTLWTGELLERDEMLRRCLGDQNRTGQVPHRALGVVGPKLFGAHHVADTRIVPKQINIMPIQRSLVIFSRRKSQAPKARITGLRLRMEIDSLD